MNTIPDFDHNLVLPPHRGDPTLRDQISPYPCTTLDLCRRFGTSPERRIILGKYLEFRPFDAGYDPVITLDLARYWVLLFSHNRQGVWKGMLRIDLDTPIEDAEALRELGAMA